MQTSIKWIIRLSTLSLCFILFGIMYSGVSYAADPSSQAKISGKVTDLEGFPIQDATIKYSLRYQGEETEKSVKTDGTGNYSILESVQDYTEISFIIEAEGYVTDRHRNTYYLSEGEQILVNFELYEPSTIVGSVTDQTGKPIPDALVKVTGALDRPVKTDQQGRYAVTGLDFDYNPNIAIWVDSADYMLYEQDRLNVQAGKTLIVDVVLTEAAHVRGKVVDEAGNPVSGAKVNAGGSATTTTTDAQGNYFIKRVPTGTRTITGEAAGYLKSTQNVTFVQGDHNTFNIVLKKDADITPPVTKYRLVPITDTVNGKIYIKGFTFRLQATDEVKGSGVKTTQYRINGGAWETYEGPVKFYAPDVKVVEYYSTDVAGNQEKYNKMDFVNGTFEGAGSY
ncbi:carboxypeptidase-like regulatory domain-containing protein [Paenibacillus sp. FSL K6-4396]|uniref:carboxypeptidase-like regulatory domain-containing protein n=1 Tax=unclassified Paenibacillus TaxID=185978 RepID=UPI00178046FE|nr:carboxypeptidase-like regulatory domain-containing protein [Paenibacillus sp. CFBP 13594]MBD8838047.1 carboxypeptidase regulatory-like domain-containing protein [Paenibacillus sp. CFBP 13594]